LASASPTILARVMPANPWLHQKLHRCQASQFRQMAGQVRYMHQLCPITRQHSSTMGQPPFLPLNQSTLIDRRVSRLKLIALSSFLNTPPHDEAQPLMSWLLISSILHL
jgi:hypothetical protein